MQMRGLMMSFTQPNVTSSIQGFWNYAFFHGKYALFLGELCAKNPEFE